MIAPFLRVRRVVSLGLLAPASLLAVALLAACGSAGLDADLGQQLDQIWLDQ